MATISFDTLKFAEKLEQAGISREHAAAMAEAQRDAFSEALETQLATKNDIAELKANMAEIGTELKLTKWMVGLSIATSIGVLSLLVKISIKLLA